MVDLGNCMPGPLDKKRIRSAQIIDGIKYFKLLIIAFSSIDVAENIFGVCIYYFF